MDSISGGRKKWFNMLKFFKKHPPKEGEERERLKKELFKFQKFVDHGFPSKPTALAYDPKLQLLAIGTKSGAIKIYGTPGYEVSAVHEGGVAVSNLFFIPEEGYVVSVCSDNSLHFWEINNRNGACVLEEKKQGGAEPLKLNAISTSGLSADFSTLYIGTETGSIHVIDVKTLSEKAVINIDSIVENVPDDAKVNLGAVEALANNPVFNDKLLIGFNRGLIVLWDLKQNVALNVFNTALQLEFLTWHRNGEEFVSAHADGSYIVWLANDPSPKESPPCPYGPFPCKAINKIQWKTAKNGLLTVFSGGMPRASYGERHTVSIIQGDNHVVADLTSKVVDFLILSRADEKDAHVTGRDDPQALVILAEEELVVLDLEDESWPSFRLPYLNSVHSSAITCTCHASNIPEQLWQKIVDAGESENKNFSKRAWPINGGKNKAAPATKDLLLTGHEDGTVRFWDASTSCLQLLYKLSTGPVFGIPDHVAPPEEEEWPPFRKVGTFDPYSDDPRLAIQKLALCVLSETLVAAGSAGQVLIYSTEKQEQDLKEVKVNIMSEHEGFVWKGHEALSCKADDLKYTGGFQPACVMQLDPPAACTALALHSEWQLVAAGTGQGFALFDYAQKKEITTRCTLNPNDLKTIAEAAVARGKSLRKSIRESFRRLRRRRSDGRLRDERKKTDDSKTDTQHIEETTGMTTNAEATAPSEAAAALSSEAAAAVSSEAPAVSDEAIAESSEAAAVISEAAAVSSEAAAESIEPAAGTSEPTAGSSETAAVSAETAATTSETKEAGGGDSKPEAAEAKVVSDSVTSVVRSLYFADTFIVNGAPHNPSLWVGTSSGNIFVYNLTVPAPDKRSADEVQCQLAKEIKLKHQAPVLSIAVIDSKNMVLPDAFEVTKERVKAPDMEGPHSVIICSEEQLKTFALPTMKPRWKNKITASDGARFRKINFAQFRREGDDYNEFDILSVTDTGDLRVYSVATLRKQLAVQLIEKENVNGISSFVFTEEGQGLYLQSPSEFSRVNVSASTTTAAVRCELELAEGLRPPPPEPKSEEAGAGDAGLVRQPTVEVTPASEEQSQEVQGEAELTTSVDDSRMDTSVMSTDITVDSVRDVIAEAENTIVTSVRTVTKTTTSTVSENLASAAQDAQRTFTAATNGLAEELQDGVTDVLRETQHEVTTRTSEFVTRTTEKVTHTGEEVIKHLSELKMTTAVIEDPALLKQKLVDTKVTTTTTTTTNITATANGEEAAE